MKKRVIGALFLIVAFAVLFAITKKDTKTAASTASDELEVEKEDEQKEEEYYTFGFTCIDMANPYYETLQQTIRLELEEKGHTLISQNPELDPDIQIQQVNELIEKGVDAVFLCPVDWEAIAPAVQALKEAEIPIINIDTQVKNIEEVDAFVGSDNSNAGYICGEDLIARFPKGGKVVILECPVMNSINERITGFEKAIANKGFEIVARADTLGDLEQARNAMAKILEEYDQIDAVMCGNDQIALGALEALEAAQRENTVVYGVDGSPELKTELSQPNTKIAGTAAQSPIGIGKSAVAVALAIVNGEDFEKFTYEPTFFINQENVGLYGTDGWQ